MTRVIHRLLAACGLTALLSAACSSFAVADIPHVDARETQRALRMPDVLLPVRELYPDLGVPAPRSPTARQGLGNSVARGGVSLLTLWDSRGSNLSLRAGSHGTVTLQWTSKLFGGDAAPGLLNRLFELANHAP
jgi:hypothetical protein